MKRLQWREALVFLVALGCAITALVAAGLASTEVPREALAAATSTTSTK